MFSLPAKALTSIISVLSGVWKFVNILSTTLNLKPGYIKIFVELVPAKTHSPLSPGVLFSFKILCALASRVLTEVVPTARIGRPSFFAAFRARIF